MFKRLGLHGLEGIAPVLIAALATEEPLLLVGPHGTAKSLLLTRIAAALGLEFRHYNASLLSFDPAPKQAGQFFARDRSTTVRNQEVEEGLRFFRETEFGSRLTTLVDRLRACSH